MTDREEVRERLAELEQEVAALRRRLESTPPRTIVDGETEAARDRAPAAGDPARGEPAGGADEHAH